MWGVVVLWLNVELKRSYVGRSGVVVKCRTKEIICGA